MSTPFVLFLILEAGMCALTFVLFGLDKWFAKRRKRRIRERTLLACLLLFGAPGGLLAMALFRHKTQHPSFWLTGTAGLLLQLAFAWLVAGYLPDVI